MATTVRNNQTSQLKILVVTGKKEDGSDYTKTRSWLHLNPDATDAQAYELCQKLGALQEYTISEYQRVDSAELAPSEDD